MQVVKIRGHFSTDVNVIDDTKPKKIQLLIDAQGKKKLRKTAEYLISDDIDPLDIKIPIRNGYITLTVPAVVPCYKVVEHPSYPKGIKKASSFRELLGYEVTVRLEVKRYSFKSKHSSNEGDVITGVRCIIIEMYGRNID